MPKNGGRGRCVGSGNYGWLEPIHKKKDKQKIHHVVPADDRKMIIYEVDSQVSLSVLLAHCSKHGPVESLSMGVGEGKEWGVYFCTYVRADSVPKAVVEMDGLEFFERPIRTDKSSKDKAKRRSRCPEECVAPTFGWKDKSVLAYLDYYYYRSKRVAKPLPKTKLTATTPTASSSSLRTSRESPMRGTQGKPRKQTAVKRKPVIPVDAYMAKRVLDDVSLLVEKWKREFTPDACAFVERKLMNSSVWQELKTVGEIPCSTTALTTEPLSRDICMEGILTGFTVPLVEYSLFHYPPYL